jgi:NTE family protein
MLLKDYNPDLLIEISHDTCGTFDFYKAEEMVAFGRAAAVKALNKLEAKTEVWKK